MGNDLQSPHGSSAPSGRYPHLLPPGHGPGPQSRRSRRGARWGPPIIALCSLPLIVAAVAIPITAGSSQSDAAGLTGVSAGLAFLVLALAAWMWRRGRDPQASFLDLMVDRVEVRRGDAINAVVRVLDPARVQGQIQLGLVCSEFWDKAVHTTDSEGNRITSRSTQRDELIADWHDVDTTAAEGSVKLAVPSGAPFSYEGDTVSWAWRVSARVERAHHSDPHRDVAIWVTA